MKVVMLKDSRGYQFLKPKKRQIPRGEGHSQHNGSRMRWLPSLAPHFGDVPLPWALPLVKHKGNLIMNLNIHRPQGVGER
jgi:hypothetical protein